MKRVHGWEESESGNAKARPPIALPTKRRLSSQAEARAASFRGIYQDTQPQTNEYLPQFRRGPDFYPQDFPYLD